MQADIDSFLISKAFAKTIYMVKKNHPVQTRSGNHYVPIYLPILCNQITDEKEMVQRISEQSSEV